MKITDLAEHFINGSKVKLTSPDISYSQEMHKLISSFSERHYEFLLWAHKQYSLELCYKNLEQASANFENNHEEYRFLILENHSNDLVGCISLFITNPELPSYEIGYWISSQAMNKGLVTDACTLLKNLACDFLKCKRLDIKIAARNERSAKVALRAGFQLEAILTNHRLDGFGRIDDTCIYYYPIKGNTTNS